MKWERVELGMLVEKVKKCLPEKDAPNTSISYVDISSIDRISKSVDQYSIQSILGAEAPSRARQILKTDDILVSTVRPNLNAVAAIPNSLNGSIGSTGFSVLRPLNGKLSSKYLLYFVQSEYFINQLMQRATGASYPAVSDKIVKETQIPLPPLPEQRRLAARLDKTDALRQKSRAVVEAYAELGRSVFLEVFGDPVKNEKGWEVIKLSEVGQLDRGVSKHRPRNAPELLGGPYPLIQTGDVAKAGLYIYDYASTYSEVGLKQSKLWPSGTLCITIAANIAKTGVLTFDACFPDSVVGFVPDTSKTNNEYVQFWLSFLQKIIEEKAPVSAQKNINLKILRNLEIPLPPLPLQTRFAGMVANIEAQRRLAERQLEAAEAVFGGVLQGAFG